MALKICTALILLLILTFASCKLLFVSELARHGARQPGVIHNFTDNPSDNFDEPFSLTDKGVRQHYLMGRELRYRYIEKEQLISEEYVNEETFFRSSNVKRTLESLNSQLFGLYTPNGDCGMKLNPYQQKNAIPPFKIDGLENRVVELGEDALPNCIELPPVFSRHNDYDYKVSMHHSKCSIYNIIREERMRSREFLKIQKPYLDKLRPIFEPLEGLTMSAEDVYSYCKYFTIAEFHQKKLNVELTPEIIENCNGVIDSQLYFKVWGNDLLWKIGAKSYLDTLLDMMDDVIEGTDTQKLHIHVGHDISVALVLYGLGYKVIETPDFAATIIFELRQDDETGNYYVNTFYNDMPITFDMCFEHNCDYKIFKYNIQQRVLPGDIEEICGYDESLSSVDDLAKKDAFFEIISQM